MNISPRQKQILLILLNEPDILSVSRLGEQLSVSKRTIQREMEGLNQNLISRGIALKSKAGKGIWLEGSQDAKYSLLEELNQELGLPVIDRERRVVEIAAELLKATEPRKLYYFANLFCVSESTVGKDMDSATRWMGQYGLTLIRRQGLGIYIEGAEASKRQALRECIKLISSKESGNATPIFHRREISFDTLNAENLKYSICGLLDQSIVKKVLLCLGSIQHPFMDAMTDYSYTGMVIHIAIAISRVMQKEPIAEQPMIRERLRSEASYLLAKRIVESLEKEFSLTIPEMECVYICLHLKGAKMQTVDKPDLSKKGDGFFVDYGKTLRLIYRMIDCYDRSLSFTLKRDEEFIEALMSHIRPTLVRLKYHMDITNPLLGQLKQSYPDVFEKCRRVADMLGKDYGYVIPEAETGYLVMHFATAVLRISQKNKILRKVRIGVVCASGIGISRLISTRMKQIFGDRVETETYGYDQIIGEVPLHLDFIVTTFQLTGIPADSILVSPMLLEENLAKIREKVEYYSSLPEKNDQQDGGKLKFTMQLDKISRISSNIKHLIEHFSLHLVPQAIDFESLVGKIGRLTGQTEENQIQIYHDIMAREQIATQVMEDFDLALLHAKTSGVSAPIFQLYLPESGGFTNPCWKGIHLAAVMLIPDDAFYMENGSILGILSSKLAENEEFTSLILTRETVQIQKYLEQTLKEFFRQYMARL